MAGVQLDAMQLLRDIVVPPHPKWNCSAFKKRTIDKLVLSLLVDIKHTLGEPAALHMLDISLDP